MQAEQNHPLPNQSGPHFLLITLTRMVFQEKAPRDEATGSPGSQELALYLVLLCLEGLLAAPAGPGRY